MIQKEIMHMRKTYSNENDKLLLTIKDACQITGLCYNTMRKVLNAPSCTFKKKIGNRVYIYKPKFEKWLEKGI